ncbi:MAG: lipoyl synthase, partial [Dehalococcoidales bacterium]
MSRLPPWFRKKLPAAGAVGGVRGLIDGFGLHTVCDSALCPNLGDCFSKGTATFLLLGDTCTRRCTFCAVAKGAPSPLDPDEPANLAEATGKLGLRHVVVTSVTRDDLADGGAAHFTRTIECLHDAGNRPTVEVLVPDFGGSVESVRTVVAARPEVINHNLETVPRLYPEVRPEA